MLPRGDGRGDDDDKECGRESLSSGCRGAAVYVACDEPHGDAPSAEGQALSAPPR